LHIVTAVLKQSTEEEKAMKKKSKKLNKQIDSAAAAMAKAVKTARLTADEAEIIQDLRKSQLGETLFFVMKYGDNYDRWYLRESLAFIASAIQLRLKGEIR
jgi:hypothetical protein